MLPHVFYPCPFNGVHPPTFPTGGACVLLVIRFQDGGRRSDVVSVPKLENDLLRRNASTTVEKLTWLKGTYYIENPSIRFMFATFQYYCICWMSKLPRLKIKHHQNYDDGSVWMCLRDRIQRQDQENLSYLMLSIIIEKEDFEVNCLYKSIWDSYPSVRKKSFLLKKTDPAFSTPFLFIKYSKTTH